MNRVFLTLLVSFLAALPVAGEENSQSIARLIRQLGDDAFAAREAATQQLIAVGVPAQPALEVALRHSDPEIRTRARLILRVVLKNDYRHRLELFAEDTSGEHDYGLPGWQRFREWVGDGLTERQMFVSMHRAEPKLMTACEAQPEKLGAALQAAALEIQQGLYQADQDLREEISLGSLMALYFVASDPNVPVDNVVGSQISNFSYRPCLHEALAHDHLERPTRKMLSRWVNRNIDSVTQCQQFMLSLRHDIADVLPAAAKALEDPGNNAQSVQYAMLVVGRFGQKEHVPLLDALMKDETVCMTAYHNNQQVQIQVRDVALAVALHMQDLKLAEFGLSGVNKDPKTLFQTHTLGFPTGEPREEAFRKYRQYRRRATSH